MSRPAISFIIPAYNEESCLGRTLDAIHRSATATAPEYEVIVVDDGSTDRTKDLAIANEATVVPVGKRHIAAVRNAGAHTATGDYLFFVDADTEINSSLLQASVKTLSSGAVGGGCRFRFDRPIPWYGHFAERIVAPLYSLAGLAGGCFLFCTRAAFESTGGFDESRFASEEVWLSLALRKRGRFVIVPEYVTTSGRKLRAYTFVETCGLITRLAMRGPASLRQRQGLDFWYGERRVDRQGIVRPSTDGDTNSPSP